MFAVSWTIPDPNYNYTVIVNGADKNNHMVPVSTNNYNVTELNGDDIYNVSIAASCRTTSTSDSVTVYGELM